MEALKGKVVLVVDDEVDLREMIAEELREEGCTVLEASGGDEAFELVKKNRIDVVVSDVQMPKGNGAQLLDNIRAINLEVPIVLFITGYSTLTVEDAYDRGAHAILSKPFDFRVLKKTIADQLQSLSERLQKRAERAPVSLEIELKFEGFEQAMRAKLMNVSRGGMFVAMSGKFPSVESKVGFRISFAVKDMFGDFEGVAITRWIRDFSSADLPSGAGFEFTELTDQARTRLMDFVDRVKPKSYIPKI